MRQNRILDSDEPAIDIYSVIIKDQIHQLRKSAKREQYEHIKSQIPEILALYEKGYATRTIADTLDVPVTFVNRFLRKKEFENGGANSLEVRIFELARLKKYQKNSSTKTPLAISAPRLAKELGSKNKYSKRVRAAIKNQNLEQMIEDQIQDDIVNIIFDTKYYNYSTGKLETKQLADDVDTWPKIADRMIRDLKLNQYLPIAFKHARELKLPVNKLGLLLVYSDLDRFKDKAGYYNYVGLAKNTGISMDKIPSILKYKDSVVK